MPKTINEIRIAKIHKRTIIALVLLVRLVLLHMRKHLACYIKDVKRAKIIRHKIVTSTDKQEIFNLICEVFKK